MARLAHWEVERMLGQMQAAARPGSDWAGRWGKWQGAYGDRMVWVEFPLGELMNPAIAGFVWAWAMQKRLVVGSIQEGDQFNAQGLEGKARVRTTLSTALVYRDLPPYRCQVVMEVLERQPNGSGCLPPQINRNAPPAGGGLTAIAVCPVRLPPRLTTQPGRLIRALACPK